LHEVCGGIAIPIYHSFHCLIDHLTHLAAIDEDPWLLRPQKAA
jgi:hypothetical protein